MTGKKYEPPLYLDMDFAEALERFEKTDPEEVKKQMETAKKKKPPGPDSPDGQTPPNGYAVKQKQEAAQSRRLGRQQQRQCPHTDSSLPNRIRV